MSRPIHRATFMTIFRSVREQRLANSLRRWFVRSNFHWRAMPDDSCRVPVTKLRPAMRYISSISILICDWSICAESDGGEIKPGWNFTVSPS